ncbi:MAG: class I SAM-dependent rRNA methyltransferase [Deltaproteobacteria bacterium]|nr:class I SAM-dependent rRNA methyltransferase [Deltaproteobacteria bacterium]
MSPAASDSMLPVVTIRARDARRVAAGHPWVFDGALESAPSGLVDGAIVAVEDPSHRLLGIGPYNGKSRIRVRLLARQSVAIDVDFFERRIRSALAVRERHLPGASSYRVVNSESDGLSGLVVDRYEDVLVLQIASLGLEQRKAAIVEALARVCKPRAILERSEGASRRFEGLEPASGLLAGSLESPRALPIRLNGLQFEVDLEAGHKTGLYLDQQANYEAVARFARGARVLDCFSFLGGFGLHAARAGAAHVRMLDQSAEAVAASLRNAAANGLDGRCEAEVANVFDWLKAKSRAEVREREAPWDLIVLDPPSFTRSRSSVPDALRGYKEIHLRALRLLAPGGVLATFCCSHHVDAQAFQSAIQAAAFDARVVLRRVACYSQSPDHPVVPSIPETEYLKGFAFEKVEEGG